MGAARELRLSQAAVATDSAKCTLVSGDQLSGVIWAVPPAAVLPSQAPHPREARGPSHTHLKVSLLWVTAGNPVFTVK